MTKKVNSNIFREAVSFNNLFIKYGKLAKKDFLISSVWVEYYQPFELELFRLAGVDEQWIYDNVFNYEEQARGSGAIYYTIIGKEFYKKREFIYVKSVVVINEAHSFIGYQTVIKNEAKALTIYSKKGTKVLFYLTTLWSKENSHTIKSLSKTIGEEVESITIHTDTKVKGIENYKTFFVVENAIIV